MPVSVDDRSRSAFFQRLASMIGEARLVYVKRFLSQFSDAFHRKFLTFRSENGATQVGFLQMIQGEFLQRLSFDGRQSLDPSAPQPYANAARASPAAIILKR